MIRVVAKPNPFHSDLVYCDIKEGMSLEDIVGIGESTHILAAVEGVPVPREAWGATYPRSGELVSLAVIPQTFGILESLAAVMSTMMSVTGATAAGAAAVNAAFSIGFGATAAAIIGNVVSVGVMIGSVASFAMGIASAVVRPQMPSYTSAGNGNGRFYSLTQANNQNSQWAYIPKLYGKFRITPPMAANVYTHVKDGEQYLHVLLCLGHGPLRVGSFEIGTTHGIPFIDSRESTVHTDFYTAGAVGYGAILIGDAGIHTYPEADWQIGTVNSIMNPPNGKIIYSQEIEEDNVSLELRCAAEMGWTDDDDHWELDNESITHTSAQGAIAIWFDITFNALYTIAGETNTSDYKGRVAIVVEYINSAVLNNGGSYRLADLDKHSSLRWRPDSGEYIDAWDINSLYKFPRRFTNGFDIWVDPDTGLDRWNLNPATSTYTIKFTRKWSYRVKHTVSSFTDCAVTGFRSFKNAQAWRPSPHIQTDDVILMALKIRASGQISGSLPPVSVLATSVLPVTTANGPGEWLPTSNPADIYPDIVRGTHLAPGSRLSADKINWSKLKEWRDYCDPGADQRTFYYNWYQVDNQPIIDRLRAVAATGRASWALVDSLLTVIMDNSFVPVQMISPRNSTGFELVKGYPNVPHALRVQWVNPESWQTDELLVLDDGYYQYKDGVYYDPFGQVVGPPAIDGLIYNPPPPNDPTVPLKPPTLYEVLETEGVSLRQQAFIEGRYYLAAMRMRRETYKSTLNIENLIATRGDCVYLAHDALLIGRATGRITGKAEVVYSGQTYIQLTLDEPIAFTQDRVFCLRIRSVDETVEPGVVIPVVKLHNPGILDPVQYAVCYNDANEPGSMAKLSKVNVGDFFVFGPVGTETIEAKITDISYSSDLSATITAVPAAPAILESDRNPIREDFPGSIPDPPPEYRAPPVPVFEAFFANINDIVITPDGVKCKVVATWSLPILGNTSRPDFVYIYYSIDGHVTWKVAYTEASLGVISLSDIPVKTTISAYLRSHNSANGKFSDPSETKTITTPDVNPWIPLAPAALFLEPISYPNPEDTGGEILYVLRCAWKIHGYSSNVEIAHTSDPLAEIGDWIHEELGAGVITNDIPIAEADIPIDRFLTVKVWVRNAVLWQGETKWSAWSKAEVDIYRRDTLPPPLEMFTGIPFVQDSLRGVKLSWTYPQHNGSTHPDVQGIEIWESRYNDRDGGTIVDGIPMPPATRLVQLELGTPEVTEYFYAIEDQAYHYYWARTKDGTGNRSTWVPIASNGGVRVFAGVKGDGAPPPPPIAVSPATEPDNWQITLHWSQPAQLPDDVVGTRIWRMEHENNNGVDEEPTPPSFDPDLVVSLGFIKELGYTDTFLQEERWYSYWMANIDFEGFESDKIGPFTDMALGDFSKYIRIIKAEQITADLINTRGLTIRDPDTSEVIFGAGKAMRPDWLQSLPDSEKLDAFIRKGAIRWAYVGGSVDAPGFLRSFDYVPTYQEGGDIIPGSGWAVNWDGSAEFRDIKARGTLLSDNYAKGLNGWRVGKNGDAEFNEGIFRGQLAADCLILGTDYPLMKIGEFALGRTINILPSGRYFKFDELGNPLSNARLTFTVENIPGVGWSATAYPAIGPSVSVPLSGTGEERYLDAAYMWNGGEPYQKIVVRAQIQADYDEVVIVGLLSDTALRIVLSQNRFNLATDSNGSVLSFSAAFGYAKAFVGVVDVTNECSFSIAASTGCTVTIVNNPEDPNHGKYVASGITVQDASASISATFGSTTLYEGFYLSKQKSGWIGGSGVFGTRAFVSSSSAYSAAYFDNAAVADSVVISTPGSGGVVYAKDVLTLINPLTGYAKTRSREWNGTSYVWVALAAFIDGNMIVRGAVTADHIEAGSINAGHIQANSINANHIAANQITANHIATNVLHADKIISGSIAVSVLLTNPNGEISGSGWHNSFFVGNLTIPESHQDRYCMITAHVFYESAVTTKYVSVRADGLLAETELYNKDGGQLDSRAFSSVAVWVQAATAGTYPVYLKVKHSADGGTAQSPRALFTFQRA